MTHRIDIKGGYRCNNHCLFCVQGDKRDRYGDKATDEIKAILGKRRPDNDEVVFTGGEVTIREDFFELVRCARDLGYETIQIQSNGRMFAYREFCEKAIAAGANNFGLALHGSRKDIHDTLTRAPGSFDQTVRGIRTLRALNQVVVTNSVITKINYTDLPRLAHLLVSLGVVQYQFAFIHINPLIKDSPELVEKLIPRKSDVKAYVQKGLQVGIDKGIRVMVEAFPCCFLDGYAAYSSERFIPPTSIEEVTVVEDFAKARKEEGKMKGPCCKRCRYDAACEGPWKEYPQIFGWREFKPVGK